MDSRRRGGKIKRSFGFAAEAGGARCAGSANPASALADAGYMPDEGGVRSWVQAAGGGDGRANAIAACLRTDQTSMLCRIAF
jgi:hypothetical protein